MVKISLAGFKDPVRRPRYIIWTGVVVLLFAAFVVVALGVTSTYWFCANVCHKVQDDAISAYNRSSHSKISCLACHMPVQADPITFVIHKAEAGILGGLHTITNDYENPLNPTSHVALTMIPEEQCTQCHSANRKITPSPGIIIDHEIHSEEGIQCTLCHNRVAHNESGDWTPVTTHPKTGELAYKHPDFMKMTACFRCHGLESGAKAPGACAKCHPSDFELKPENHFKADFYPRGHADMALEEIERVKKAMATDAHGEEGGEATKSEEATKTEDGSEGTTESKDGASLLGPEKAYASGGTESEWVKTMPAMSQVNYCSTCHKQSFCDSCHGMEIPHPKEFVDKSHPELVKTKLDKCDMCHQVTKTGFKFCNDCHHGTKSNWKYDPKVAWETQHAKTVTANGVGLCLEACHKTTFCSDCHTKKKPVPSSHAAKDWLRKKAEALGVHADGFKAQPTSCEVCHGPNEPNGNKFCKGCHVLEMPHEQEFKNFHAKTGSSNRKACANCHTFKELCSDCHHEGAINGTPWLKVHGPVVNTSGGA
ncbi:MAG: NapC/NirT family cytochrome c, partial [Coriobacteriia bacterium]|nr:NapC/NirT family cytochrome c [Coriobacteriia bacterium]